MLTEIQIKNYVIADQVDLNFKPGMSTLTGETGAGKSILLDAIGLVLGDRADSAAVREGADRTDITASFAIDSLPDVTAWLDEHELNGDEICHIRRIVGADGRSKAFINGIPSPLALLRELGEQLVDIHGQHEHQSLMKKGVQLQILDRYAHLEAMVSEMGECFTSFRRTQKRLHHLVESRDTTLERETLLRFQIDELSQLGLKPGEYEEITQRHTLLAHTEETVAACGQAAWLLDQNDSANAVDMLRQCLQWVHRAAEFDPRLNGCSDILDSAMIQVQEASSQLRRLAEETASDPAELALLEDRLQVIHDLARKHRCEPDDLPELLHTLTAELNQLGHSQEEIDALENQLATQRQRWFALAEEVSLIRHKKASELSDRITAMMQELGMKGGVFAISVVSDTTDPTPTGLDSVEFNVSANAGQSPRPLAKVASGGELARISLALQVAAAGTTAIPTLIFDEVDSGIGGAIAEIVGQKLRELGESVQVICVTHLPQVASRAHHHFSVCKNSESGHTTTSILPLQGQDRVDEIARMLGGITITETALRHANEMIAGNKAR
jgi:DNA repair protein RecN (Recombination protein N)